MMAVGVDTLTLIINAERNGAGAPTPMNEPPSRCLVGIPVSHPQRVTVIGLSDDGSPPPGVLGGTDEPGGQEASARCP